MDTTTIEISVTNWEWLNRQKRPGESFNDVLDRLRTGSVDTTTDQEDTAPADLELADELPGSGDRLDERRATVARLYAYLQDHGTASKDDFLELVDADRVGYASPESFWANCIKGRDTLRALPGVEPPGQGATAWRYTGD